MDEFVVLISFLLGALVAGMGISFGFYLQRAEPIEPFVFPKLSIGRKKPRSRVSYTDEMALEREEIDMEPDLDVEAVREALRRDFERQ